jgi:hypothetical protein
MRIKTSSALLATVCGAAAILLGGCNPRANHTGFEHQNLNAEDSQVDWIPHTYFRGINSDSFTATKAPEITSTHEVPTTQNPTPVGDNLQHGATNTKAFGRGYQTSTAGPKY